MTRDDLISLYLEHARRYYRRSDGTPTRHADNLELATRPLRSSLPKDLTLAELVAYRDGLIARGLARTTINQWVGWVRTMYRWAAQNQHVEPAVSAQLALLDPLRRGRSAAREPAPVPLVTRDQVVRVLPHLPATVRRMVCVQWLCGMRVGEVAAMTTDALRRLDGYVVYLPRHHKTLHHDRPRNIVIVSRAIEYIEWSRPDLQFPNQIGNMYTRMAYGAVVRRACARAGVETWSPGWLRRSAATHARRLVGAEGVQRLLGHASADMTERYFGLELVDAVQSARELDEAGWHLATKSCGPLTPGADRE